MAQIQVLWGYKKFMSDLYQMIVYIGDISGLGTDSELENAYLVAAAVHELPQAQERVVEISNLLRTLANDVFTEEQKTELERNLVLLVHSDNSRIQNRFDRSEIIRKKNKEAEGLFGTLLKNCYDTIEYFANTVEYVMDSPVIEQQAIGILNEAARRVYNAIFHLQEASLDRLETLITGRIKTNQRHFIWSLVLAIIATVAAFTIIFITALNIRKSTHSVNSVFRRLENNDLSVNVEVFSRDELGALMLALGGFLEKLKTAFASFNQNASLVSTAVYDLSASAKEITTTANEQSASVAEIVSTMENTKNLSAQVASKTVEVAQLAAQTQELSQRGAELRDDNENMMADIRNKNAKIVEEIKNLTDILSSIDESVQLIDAIADQTKLIAFNAALEASSSGEAGLRFAVVASEIRRFADNVAESVAEIKEKIADLQGASGTLISEANNGSRAIDSGYNRMVEQKEVFENIVDVSQNVAIRSQQITNLSKQQELASEQVFTALKEISAGVRQFVTAIASTSATADKLNVMSVELKETLVKYQAGNRGNV
jgi:methyl-accepting chemotaxis protein